MAICSNSTASAPIASHHACTLSASSQRRVPLVVALTSYHSVVALTAYHSVVALTAYHSVVALTAYHSVGAYTLVNQAVQYWYSDPA
jgi:hypothetical protein